MFCRGLIEIRDFKGCRRSRFILLWTSRKHTSPALFTDDTQMSIAIAKALIESDGQDIESVIRVEGFAEDAVKDKKGLTAFFCNRSLRK